MTVINPWELTDQALIEDALYIRDLEIRKGTLREINHSIGHNNRKAIEESDLLVAVLDGLDIDSGTACEIGYAAAHGKKIIGIRNDFRLCGDNEAACVNIQVEYFINDSGGKIITTINELKKTLASLDF